jgi:uncharacterized protein GlcG (DUF336 family)
MIKNTLLKLSFIFGLVLATLASSSSFAELLAHKDITSSIAMSIAETAVTTCKGNGLNISVTVVGRNGEVLVQVRGDNTGPHTMENSMRKAYTARTFRSPSGDTETRLKNDPAFALIHLNNIIANRGGLPIKAGEDTIGGVGASGAPSGDKDEACVKAGIDKVANLLN